MFEQTFVNAQAQTRKPWTVLTSLTLQCGLVAALLIVPLLHVAKLDVLPKVEPMLHIQKIELTAQPAVKPIANAPRSSFARTIFRAPTLTVPTSVPAHIDMTPDAPSIAMAQNSTAASTLSSLMTEIPAQPMQEKAKPEPAKPSAGRTSPVHIGGSVLAAKLIYSPRPAYPRTALITRTQGSVVLRAIIARDGSISNLQLISGQPLLVQAAIEAVRQWRYQPTLLNGEPVEVLTEITVNFTLQ